MGIPPPGPDRSLRRFRHRRCLGCHPVPGVAPCLPAHRLQGDLVCPRRIREPAAPAAACAPAIPDGPKLLVGFSDVTALHVFINQHWGWPTLHGRNPGRSRKRRLSQRSLEELREVVVGGTSRLMHRLRPLNSAARRPRAVCAPFIGGNLKTLQSLLGTPWGARPAGCILHGGGYRRARLCHRPHAGPACPGRHPARRPGAGVRPVHRGTRAGRDILPARRSSPASRSGCGFPCSGEPPSDMVTAPGRYRSGCRRGSTSRPMAPA